MSARRSHGHGPARFVTGPLLKHILVMTGAGAVGLVAIFLGDLANVLFLSWQGDETVVAAVGYASSILFFTISIGIGLSIAAAALVAPALGALRPLRGARTSGSAHLMSLAASAVLSILVLALLPWLLSLVGASGRAHELAARYLTIIVPTTPLLALAMTSAAVLRSTGDARRAMSITISIAIVNAILDLILIVWLGLGIEGAAWSSAAARAVAAGVGLHGVGRVHPLLARPTPAALSIDCQRLAGIALPAVLTNVASPVANAYVTGAIAAHGDGAVAGWAVISRILPLAFGAIYALSASIGPILGQNFGAGNGARLRQAFTLSLVVNGLFTALAWLMLAIAAEPLVRLFHASGAAADLILLFCRWIAPLFVFMGALFVANAAFNTLGRPQLSTWLNWGRATVGTVPLVQVGGVLAGADGVLWGFMLGALPFGLLACALCYRLIGEIARRDGARTDVQVRGTGGPQPNE